MHSRSWNRISNNKACQELEDYLSSCEKKSGTCLARQTRIIYWQEDTHNQWLGSNAPLSRPKFRPREPSLLNGVHDRISNRTSVGIACRTEPELSAQVQERSGRLRSPSNRPALQKREKKSCEVRYTESLSTNKHTKHSVGTLSKKRSGEKKRIDCKCEDDHEMASMNFML